ncbi:DUF2730 family protein [Marivita sp.]|jgi:uncharacterized membrane protein (DUF106 family)|uniref:DUF2730 family protein n=1 Tax=Marivita sp. TaxID=2003365 RepID=UPI003F706CC0
MIDPKLFLDALALLISVAVGVYAFFVNRRTDVDQRFHDGTQRMNRLQERISNLETEFKQMPGKDEVTDLRLLLADMGGDMKAMTATMHSMAKSMERLENSVTRHEDHLRDSR